MISNAITQVSTGARQLAMGTLRVDVIADLVCPWCFMGKRRLDTALAAVHGPRQLRFLPYQLNPGMPADGMGFEEYLASKFGDPAVVQPGLDDLAAKGRDDGIGFRFDLIRRVPNTMNAHRLMALAAEQGADTAFLAEDLMRSFFEEGLDIGDRDVLVDIAGGSGLGRSAVLQTLEDDRTRNRVHEQESELRRGGVSGVPDFLVNERLMVLGAQPVSVLVDAFDRAMFGDESDQPLEGSLH